jgi:hypothetical protein
MAKVNTWQGTPHTILQFECPGCKYEHAIPVTTGMKESQAWLWNGDADKPTLQPSLLVNVGGSNPTVPICHSFVTEGKIQFLGDSQHELAGQTVEIPDWEDA